MHLILYSTTLYAGAVIAMPDVGMCLTLQLLVPQLLTKHMYWMIAYVLMFYDYHYVSVVVQPG
jgi:hypothetical protein